MRRKFPIGIEFFDTMIRDDFYYIDKTGLIAELLNNWSYVTLFTRPRRFGKSLNMSMLQNFFDPDTDKSLFNGLRIMQEKALCEEYMGRYPVIFLSLKGVDAGNYETAFLQMAQIIREAAVKVDVTAGNDVTMHPARREDLGRLLQADINEADLCGSLYTLCEILEKHYDRKVIVLIDEYDVPLASAYEHGYYDQMVLLIRSLFHKTLKTNPFLKFAVLTGCMRISKESIFTGLNNLRVMSVSDSMYDEYFGFTDEEVRDLLDYYDLSAAYNAIKGWYDGYRFGDANVYCPWDVMNYCSKLMYDPELPPENYWINSSSNDVVRRFIAYSDNTAVRNEMERLINGEAVEKTVYQELTYQDMYDSIDHLWSVLFTTGYLTYQERMDGRRFRLVIPNEEVRDIFREQILSFFEENVKKDGATLGRFCDALQRGDAAEVEKGFTDYLRRTISIRDTFVRKSAKENFYHGILVGILGVKELWGTTSNHECGDGYSDIFVTTETGDQAILIELKYAEDGNLDRACREALDQIDEKRYAEDLYYEGYEHVLKYGIACYKKRCRVLLAEQGE